MKNIPLDNYFTKCNGESGIALAFGLQKNITMHLLIFIQSELR